MKARGCTNRPTGSGLCRPGLVMAGILAWQCLLLAWPSQGAEERDWSSLKLWYLQPTMPWSQALPIGNGRLGARVFGGTDFELLQLNEDTLWSGGPREGDNPQARDVLPRVREALFAGRYSEAHELCRQMQGPYTESYQPLGNLYLEFDDGGVPGEYRRELDLDRAVVVVRYQIGEVTYGREVFASFPDQVIVMRLTCDKAGGLSFRVRMDSPLWHRVVSEGRTGLILQGKCPKHVDPGFLGGPRNPIVYDEAPDGEGMRFEGRLEVRAEGGTVAARDGRIHVAEADGVVLLFSAATSYNGPDKEPGREGVDPGPKAKVVLEKLSGKSYDEMLSAHVADYRRLFRRVWLELGGEQPETPTDQRIAQYGDGRRDPQLVALMFQYARYLMIACSRPGSQPAMLQGMWTADVRPRWSNNYMLNESIQKCYNVVETANLAECAEPLIDLIEDLARHGHRTAETNYGCDGWVAHHHTDLWRTTAPVGNGSGDPAWANWPMGGVWLCQHLWEHHAFGDDEEYLRNRAYPIMKGAAEFCLDWLVEDNDGHLVTAPSTSPENLFRDPDNRRRAVAVSIASTMDMALIRELLSNCIEASEELGIDEEFRERLVAARSRLYAYQIGRRGQLQEWFQDFEEVDRSHRHASHLVGVWPLSQITPRATPELFAAARRSLEFRGRGGGMPDKPAMWARLRDGDQALWSLSVDSPSQFINPYGALPEMLAQSHAGEIELLPAVPRAWPQGEVSGLRARGGFEVGIAWKDGRLERATLTSRLGKTVRVRAAVPVDVSSDGRTVEVTHFEEDEDVVELPTEREAVYTFVRSE